MNMPGIGRHRFEWVGKPPVYWSILFLAFFISMAFSLLGSFFLPHLATRNPDLGHSYSAMINGSAEYVWPWLGWLYDKAERISVALFGSLILIMIVKHDQVRKVG